jgi:hypothetical protein
MKPEEKKELKDVHLGPNREDIEKKADKIRHWIIANGIFEIKIPVKKSEHPKGMRDEH